MRTPPGKLRSVAALHNPASVVLHVLAHDYVAAAQPPVKRNVRTQERGAPLDITPPTVRVYVADPGTSGHTGAACRATT
jgi:hypothetical protein